MIFEEIDRISKSLLTVSFPCTGKLGLCTCRDGIYNERQLCKMLDLVAGIQVPCSI